MHLGEDRKVIVLGLRAPNDPTPKRTRRTFWTACASCKEKNKYTIEHLNRNITCLHCSKLFTAVEISRPRKQSTSIKNVQPVGALLALSRTLEESGNPASLLKKRWFVPVGKPLLSRFPNRERQSGTKRGCPFVPGVATGTKEDLLSRLVTPTGTKCLFFSCFSFLNSFSISIILLHFN